MTKGSEHTSHRIIKPNPLRRERCISKKRGRIIKLRKASLAAWILFAAVSITAVYNTVVVLSDRPAGGTFLSVVNDLLWGSLGIVFAFLGALIVSKKPKNVIGWLIFMPAVAMILSTLSQIYLDRITNPPSEMTLALLLAVLVDNFAWLLLIYPLFFTMLLFPDGKPLTPRWRWVVVAGLAMIAFLLLFGLFSSSIGPVDENGWALNNPIGLLSEEFEFPFTLWSIALAIVALFSAAAPFVRYRRSKGVQREQIKWLFYACGLFILCYLPGFLIVESESVWADIWGILFIAALVAIPAAITIAILRFRLYDINFIIRKTLLYAVLISLLAVVYFGTVILTQSLFEILSGQQSPLIIVISTLVIAALFSPLRRRIKDLIDRRFFRQAYDAQQVLAQFAEAARNEVELETLTHELARAALETMHPEKLNIWIRDRG